VFSKYDYRDLVNIQQLDFELFEAQRQKGPTFDDVLVEVKKLFLLNYINILNGGVSMFKMCTFILFTLSRMALAKSRTCKPVICLKR
jgi:hypothetical protein